MKLKIRDKSFIDNESKKKVDFKEVYTTIVLFDVSYDIVIKFNDKTSKDMIINNIDKCVVDTKQVSYTKQDGTKVEYVAPICKCNLNGFMYEFDITIKERAEIFLIDVLKNRKQQVKGY